MIAKYRDIRFTSERQGRIAQLETILLDYPDQKLSSRQLYYQFVSRDLITNEERSYRLITKLITDARYAGIVDWDSIEDRGREPIVPLEFNSIKHRIEAALRSYRLPRWQGQGRYVELWVEKQALAGVLAPIADRFHVTLMVNKGYSSASAMKESALRMKINAERMSEDGIFSRPTTVLYLGDHDPSGKDMVRDIRDRLQEFGVEDLSVQTLGLTMEQIRKFNPPPNPTKVTDSRAKAYIEEYGEHSWELDALPPKELNRIVSSALEASIDIDRMNDVIAKEQRDKLLLRNAVAKIMKVAE